MLCHPSLARDGTSLPGLPPGPGFAERRVENQSDIQTRTDPGVRAGMSPREAQR
jgi:hypothetical protein